MKAVSYAPDEAGEKTCARTRITYTWKPCSPLRSVHARTFYSSNPWDRAITENDSTRPLPLVSTSKTNVYLNVNSLQVTQHSPCHGPGTQWDLRGLTLYQQPNVSWGISRIEFNRVDDIHTQAHIQHAKLPCLGYTRYGVDLANPARFRVNCLRSRCVVGRRKFKVTWDKTPIGGQVPASVTKSHILTITTIRLISAPAIVIACTDTWQYSDSQHRMNLHPCYGYCSGSAGASVVAHGVALPLYRDCFLDLRLFNSPDLRRLVLCYCCQAWTLETVLGENTALTRWWTARSIDADAKR